MSSSTSAPKSYRPPGVPAIYYENQKYGFVGIQIALVFYGKCRLRGAHCCSPIHCILQTGVAALLFIQSSLAHIRMLRKPGKDNRRSKKIQLAYISALFILATVLIVAESYVNGLAALNYPLYPGGAYAWSLSNYNEPVFMLTQVPFVVTVWLTDGFMVSRLFCSSKTNYQCANCSKAVPVLRGLHSNPWDVVYFLRPYLTLYQLHR